MATVPIINVYQAYRGAGFTDAQARALAAETGRETGFQQKFLFGTHSDPANQATNVGVMSFQGPRREALMDYMRQSGRLNEQGQIIPSQESLLAQAKFVRQEIETNPAYERTKNVFLANPNIDPEAAAEVLGRNYIKWRYNDPRYAAHHETRRNYLAQLPADAQEQQPSLLSPTPMASTAQPAKPAAPVYSQDLGTQFRLLGNAWAPDWVDKPTPLTEEQAAAQIKEQNAAKQQLSQANDAMKAFQALQAYGQQQQAIANQPMSLLQPNIVRGQFRPIQPMRGLL